MASFPSPTLSTFLTVKEAAELTGKSSSSIRRVLYPIIQQDDHPDRTQIQPSVAEVLQLRLKGENFAWRMSEELLRREIPPESAAEKGSASATSKSTSNAEGELLSMLRRELDIKNQQITQQSEFLGKQMELLNGLSERLREGNILIASLQQRLSLTDGREAKPVKSVDVKRSAPAKPEKGSGIPAKAPKQKHGILSRLFGQ